MNRIILTTLSLLLFSSCSMDSIERRKDFSISTYSVDDVNLNVTFRGTEWKEYNENGKKISEWVGPYRLYIYTKQPEKTDYKITVSSAEIKYADGTIIKDISIINLEEIKSWEEGINKTMYLDGVAINLKYQPIIVNLNLSYIENEQSFSTKISLLVKPKLLEKPYNSLWAAFMSV